MTTQREDRIGGLLSCILQREGYGRVLVGLNRSKGLLALGIPLHLDSLGRKGLTHECFSTDQTDGGTLYTPLALIRKRSTHTQKLLGIAGIRAAIGTLTLGLDIDRKQR